MSSGDMPCKYIFDTSAILENPKNVLEFEGVGIPLIVVKELDNLKTDIGEKGFKAREAIRVIKNANNIIRIYHPIDNRPADEQVIDQAIYNNAILITNDYAMQLQAEYLGVKVIQVEAEEDNYTGWKEVRLSNNEMADFYEHKDVNRFNLLIGQYLIICDENGLQVDAYKWNGETHKRVAKKTINSQTIGKLVPKDFYQMCAIDSLLHNDLTMIKGKAGSGKSLISLVYAMSMIENKDYDRIICFVNPVDTRDAAKLGFLPGDNDDKLLGSFIGNMLGSKFGDKVEVERMIEDKKLMLIPMSHIRGFDTSGSLNTIVYIAEAQNMNIDLMKLAIQRCGNNTKVIIDGDYKQQVDSVNYEGRKNGMRRVSEVFRGEKYYGEIELPNIYRSEIAKKADEM